MSGVNERFGSIERVARLDKEGAGDMEKKAYTPPKLKKWGTVADLTKTGRTNPGADGKGGSAASQGQ